MAVRLSLPNRIQLQTLSGMRNAIVGGVNATASNVINTNDALAFINAFEDDFLVNLRLIWMRVTDYNIPIDQYGRFDLRLLNQPVQEVVSVYANANLSATTNNAYWQYQQPFDRKDLTSFRKLQGVLNVQPIYCIDGPYVYLWPQRNFYGPMACEYYAEWPRLGDYSSSSTLQQITVTISGTATASGTITFQTAGQAVATLTINNGDTSAVILQNLLNLKIVYATDAGGNDSYWTPALTGPTTVVLTAPTYVTGDVTVAISQTGATGITSSLAITQNALIDTVQTNWFLTNYPYLYFYGALKHAFLYLNDLERAKWASDQASKMTIEIQQKSDRADVSDPSDGFFWNSSVQW